MRTISLARIDDGVAQLQGEHQWILMLLRAFERVVERGPAGHPDKAEIVDCLCDALSLHAQMAMDVFYPQVRVVLEEESRAIAQVFCDHQRLLDLIAWVDELEPGHRDCDRMVRLMGDCALRGFEQQQEVLRNVVRTTGLDTLALGKRMAQYRKNYRRDLAEVQAAPGTVSTAPAPHDLLVHWFRSAGAGSGTDCPV